MAIVRLSSKKQIHHIALRVPDASKTANWYRDVFGFDVEREFAYAGLNFIWLRPSAKHPVIVEVIGGGALALLAPQADGVTQPGFTHLCLCVADIDQAMGDLAAAGVRIVFNVMPGPQGSGIDKAVFIADPWENLIELVQLSADSDASAGFVTQTATYPTSPRA